MADVPTIEAPEPPHVPCPVPREYPASKPLILGTVTICVPTGGEDKAVTLQLLAFAPETGEIIANPEVFPELDVADWSDHDYCGIDLH